MRRAGFTSKLFLGSASTEGHAGGSWETLWPGIRRCPSQARPALDPSSLAFSALRSLILILGICFVLFVEDHTWQPRGCKVLGIKSALASCAQPVIILGPHYNFCLFVSGHTRQYSGLNPCPVLRGPYGVREIEPVLAACRASALPPSGISGMTACKASALPAVQSRWPSVWPLLFCFTLGETCLTVAVRPGCPG